MSKEDFILEVGIVAESLPNATFRVEVPGQEQLILCHLSGKMRKNFIKVLPGDRVLFEMSPYDLSRGRITRRLKPGEDPLNPTPTEISEPTDTPVVTPEIVPSETNTTQDKNEE